MNAWVNQGRATFPRIRPRLPWTEDSSVHRGRRATWRRRARSSSGSGSRKDLGRTSGRSATVWPRAREAAPIAGRSSRVHVRGGAMYLLVGTKVGRRSRIGCQAERTAVMRTRTGLFLLSAVVVLAGCSPGSPSEPPSSRQPDSGADDDGHLNPFSDSPGRAADAGGSPGLYPGGQPGQPCHVWRQPHSIIQHAERQHLMWSVRPQQRGRRLLYR